MVMLLVLVAGNVHAQLDEQRWEEEREGKNYSRKEKVKDTDKKDPEFDGLSLPKKDFLNSLSGVKKMVIAVLVLVLILAIFFMLREAKLNNVGGKKVVQNLDIEIEEVEEHLLELDLSGLILNAEQNENWKRVLRLRYLQCIQLLDEHSLVVWKKDKTNFDYLNELKNRDYKRPFSFLTKEMDVIIYSEMETTKGTYQNVNPQLINFIQLFDE